MTTETEAATLLRAALDKQGVADPTLRAGIAAIAMGESGFVSRTESSYAHTSNERLREVFGSRLTSYSDAALTALKARDEDFFNVVYGGAWGLNNLGNDQIGDGYRYRGRGFVQLTGRANYQRLARLTGLDLVGNPDAANDPAAAAAIIVAYIRDHNPGADWQKIKRVVGNNTPDIAARKDVLFAEYLASGEFAATAAPEPAAPEPSWLVAVRALEATEIELLQRGLAAAGVTDYEGRRINVDGDLGKSTKSALIKNRG